MLINSMQTVLKDANNCWKYLEQKVSAILNPWRTLLDSVDFLNKKTGKQRKPPTSLLSKKSLDKSLKLQLPLYFFSK